ncbi:hypothetical protein HW555_011420, partial [Spodoptera exigua]
RELFIKMLLYIIMLIIILISVLSAVTSQSVEEEYANEDKKLADSNNMSDSIMLDSVEQMMILPPFELITYEPTIQFEGVDYDLIPTEEYNYYYDCYYIHTECVRDTTYFDEVCAYSLVHGWLNFATLCDVDLQNCLHRVEKGINMYGEKPEDGNDFIFYSSIYWPRNQMPSFIY